MSRQNSDDDSTPKSNILNEDDNVVYIPFPKASDFESVRFEIAAANTTARTDIKGEITLIQILEGKEGQENGLILELPAKSCSKGHFLAIKMVGVEGAAKGKVDFETTAKVEKVKDLDERQEVRITLVQYEEADWKKLTGVFSSRQDEILEFFKAAKGL